MTSDDARELREKNRQLLEENQRLQRQLEGVLGAQHFEPLPHRKRLSQIEKKFMTFINQISQEMNDPDLNQLMADAFLKELEVDRVVIMVSTGQEEAGLVITHQAMKQGVMGAYLPYYNSLQEQTKPYNRFLKEVLETGLCIYRIWEQPVEVVEGVHLKGACALSVRDVKGGAFLVCLQWMEEEPEWGRTEKRLFEDLVRYSTLLLSQVGLIQSLEEMEEQHRSLIESMPSAIIGLDFLGNVTLWNSHAEHFFKHLEEDVLGKSISRFIPEFSGLAQEVLEAFQSNEEEVLLKQILRKNSVGKNLYLQPHLFSLMNMERGEIAIRIDDVTHQEELQHQLLETQKREWVGQLAGGLAREFNNCLGGILGGVQQLQKGWKLNPQAKMEEKQELEVIEKSAHRATNLVHRLLILAGQKSRTSEKIDLVEIVERNLELIRSSFDVGVQIHFQRELPRGIIYGVNSQVESALHNLVFNACEAMEHSGEILISISKGWRATGEGEIKKPFYELRVEDSGKGMSQEILTRAFNPLFTTKEGAVGLGLSIVQKVMAMHGGQYEIKSIKGKGSAVSLFFPCDDEYVLKEERSNQQTEKVSTVLLVEEDNVLRKLMTKVLQNLDLKVQQVSDGVEAVKLHNTNKVELMVLDWDLPGFNGQETFYLIRQLNPFQKCIITTAYPDQEELSEVQKKEGVELLLKPFHVDQLEQIVRKFLPFNA